MSRQILVIKRDNLFKEKVFDGFIEEQQQDFIKNILEKYEYQERNDELERNSSFQQIIPYVWIVNPETKKIFAYRRAIGKQNYSETRLMNKWSCGVGGHIDKDTEEKSTDPIIAAMMREMKEEVLMENYPLPKIVGYINDDSDEVGKVHFGVVALAETKHNVEKGDSEMAHGQFYSINELEEIFSNSENKIESWTKASWPYIKNYVSRLEL
ncbi:hypothetical protein CXT76_02335 [Candidatus Parvarchaeota archaeon]|jgi:predicted NUDIX family phosphoesterase|nr:MAG: hypothetical protein CXT76_02335 [Candidatus Parvarchaeota archaeon]